MSDLPCTLHPFRSRADWLAGRRNGLGGSDIPTLLGCGFGTPLELWGQKTGKIDEDPNAPGSLAMQLGVELEPFVARKVSETWGHHLVDLGRHTIVRQAAHPWRQATVDRLVVPQAADVIATGADALVRARGGLEIKTTDAGADAWIDGPSPAALVQSTWCMIVSGISAWEIAALFGFRRLDIFQVDYDADLVDLILETADRFWHQNVLADVPPEEYDLQAVKRVWRKTTEGRSVALARAAFNDAAQLLKLKEQAADLKKQIDELEAKLRFAMQDAELAVPDDGVADCTLTLKTTKRTVAPQPARVDEFRTLRVKRAKEG